MSIADRSVVAFIPVIMASALSSAALAGVEFYQLGDFPPFSNTYGLAVSPDGAIASGHSIGPAGTYRWTRTTGYTAIPGIEVSAFCTGISIGGAIMTGHTSESNGRAWTWSATTQQMTFLDGLPGAAVSSAFGVSSDGLTIVGSSSPTVRRATRWSSGVPAALPALQAGASSAAFAVTADGSRIVGVSGSAAGDRAVVWNGLNSAVSLGVLQGYTASTALAISPEGSVVVGRSFSGASDGEATRWLANGTAEGLGRIGGIFSAANAASSDGEIIVGSSDPRSGQFRRAFLWTETAGMVDLNSYLTSHGVDLSRYVLTSASAISADGTVIVGNGFLDNSQHVGWVAIIPAPASLSVPALFVLAARRRRDETKR